MGQENEESDERFEIMKILGYGVRKAIRGKGEEEDGDKDAENLFDNEKRFAGLTDAAVI